MGCYGVVPARPQKWEGDHRGLTTKIDPPQWSSIGGGMPIKICGHSAYILHITHFSYFWPFSGCFWVALGQFCPPLAAFVHFWLLFVAFWPLFLLLAIFVHFFPFWPFLTILKIILHTFAHLGRFVCLLATPSSLLDLHLPSFCASGEKKGQKLETVPKKSGKSRGSYQCTCSV